MENQVTFDDHGDGIGAAWLVLSDHLLRTPAEAPVPTCPGWTLRDLVAHQGMVHRWAAATLRGERLDTDAVERVGQRAVDLRAWLDEGAKDLLQAFVDTPDDLDVWFFLPGAGPARQAWARRQCHETSIHAVDAMAATLGRPPRAEETWLRPALAADGLDELLTGFVARDRHGLRSAPDWTVRIETTDTGDAWTLLVTDEAVRVERGGVGEPDTVLAGTAVRLHLGLWNRGDEITETGRPFLPMWRERVAVSWS